MKTRVRKNTNHTKPNTQVQTLPPPVRKSPDTENPVLQDAIQKALATQPPTVRNIKELDTVWSCILRAMARLLHIHNSCRALSASTGAVVKMHYPENDPDEFLGQIEEGFEHLWDEALHKISEVRKDLECVEPLLEGFVKYWGDIENSLSFSIRSLPHDPTVECVARLSFTHSEYRVFCDALASEEKPDMKYAEYLKFLAVSEACRRLDTKTAGPVTLKPASR